MDINLDSALQTYIVEARELLQDMEKALLQLEGDPNDNDTIDRIFRGAHTIKGSAGLFGLSPVVGFTHWVEDVLDRVRDGLVVVDRDLIALLLSCTDHIAELVDVVVEQGGSPDPQVLQREAALRERLLAYQTDCSVETLGGKAQPKDEEMTLDGQPCVASPDWHISLRMGDNVFRNGMDPFSFLRYLNTLGEILGVATTAQRMPELVEMDAESCYLGFEIRFRSQHSQEAIAEVFDFVRDDCAIQIITPNGSLAAYRLLVGQLPEDPESVGQLLLACGSVNASEWQQILHEVCAVAALPTDSLPAVFEGAAPVSSNIVAMPRIRETKARENVYVRVHADKLDELINLVGELVIAGAGARLLAKDAIQPELRDATAGVADLVEKTLDCALSMRMVPIGDTFSRFQRVVRDVSQELGKDIELVISGGDTELDKTVVDSIGDPLMHLMRNAMDHGIEMPGVRVAAGKPAKGRLRLNAFHDAGNIILEIADDGAGLDRERILEKAREANLLAATATPSDSEIYSLIFEPGFSTAAAVTNLSGRGVGMDVVKRNITALRGTIDLDSLSGQGTTIRIRLPLTLAIIHGFLVGVGEASYVVPLERVQECLELSPDAHESARRCGYIDLRGQILPLLFLRDYFAVEGRCVRRQNVVVVHYLNKKIGLVVDELMGEYQTVIKPLGKLFGALHGIGGSSILGSGAVALILDIPALFTRLSEDEQTPALTRSSPVG